MCIFSHVPVPDGTGKSVRTFPDNSSNENGPSRRGKPGPYEGMRRLGQRREGLGDFAGRFFEEFVDQGLVGFGLLGGHAAELAEKLWGDTDGDELFGVAGGGAADSTGTTKLGDCRFGDVREVELAIRCRLGVLCASPGAC